MSDEKPILFSQVPDTFLKDVFLAPHNFSDPENPQHGLYVHQQLRGDLYEDTLYKISDLEFKLTSNPQEFVKVEQFSECSRKDSLLQYLKTKAMIDDNQEELIKCEDWRVSNSEKAQRVYRVKYFQSKNDRFFSLIFPPFVGQYFKLYNLQK